MTDIPDGHGIIAGRSGDNARAALAAAEKAGVSPSEVLAVEEGYLVPQSVLDAFHAEHSDYVAPDPVIATDEQPAEGSAAPPADVTVLDPDLGTVPDEGSAAAPEEPVVPDPPDPTESVDPPWGSAGPPEEPSTEDPVLVPLDDSPTTEWKNADIKDWAAAHDVDLGDATTKADMLAAITAADTKEE